MTEPGDPAIRRAAMDLLARREHSRRELVDKLSRRFGDGAALALELDRLAEEGLQSDLRFAFSHARQRALSRRGPALIRAELRQRGVGDALVAQALAEVVAEQDIDWVQQAASLARDRFGEIDRVRLEQREYARRARFLQSRGFSGEQVRRALAASSDY